VQGILGVIDGVVPTDFETDEDKKERHAFLRTIGYKR
jgi:adenosine/AMP kinase